jgi:hypothetical protein
LSQQREINSIDRTTRLIATLTIAGGIAFLIKIVFSAWFKTFSTSAYTKKIINFEYIVSVVIVTVTIVIAFSIVKYLYFELKTYIFYENRTDQQNAIQNADNAFGGIFKNIKICGNSLLVIGIIGALNEIFNDKHSWKFIMVGVSIGGIFILTILLVNKDKIKKIIKVTDAIELKITPYSNFLFVGLLSLFVGLTITIFSIDSNQNTKITIQETKTVPIKIELQNNYSSLVYININNSKGETSIDPSKVSFVESYVEVLEKNKELKTSKEIEQFVKNLNKENDKLNISKTKYIKVYSTDLEKYLVDGKNEVEVIVYTTNSNNSKATHFITTVTKDGANIEITEKNIEI